MFTHAIRQRSPLKYPAGSYNCSHKWAFQCFPGFFFISHSEPAIQYFTRLFTTKCCMVGLQITSTALFPNIANHISQSYLLGNFKLTYFFFYLPIVPKIHGIFLLSGEQRQVMIICFLLLLRACPFPNSDLYRENKRANKYVEPSRLLNLTEHKSQALFRSELTESQRKIRFQQRLIQFLPSDANYFPDTFN